MRKLHRYLIPFLVWFFASQNSYAMRQVELSGNARIHQTLTAYNFISGAAAAFTTNAAAFREFSPRDGVLSKLKVELSAAPGLGKSVTFTVVIDGSDTAMTCMISDNSLSCNFNPPVEIPAGKILFMKEVPQGTPTSSLARYSVVLTTASNRELILTGGKAIVTSTGPAEAYIPAHGGTATEITSEFLARTTMPFSGKITELHANFPPGTGAQTTTFTTLLKGNATNQTCAAVDSTGFCSDTIHPVSFSAGDSVSIYNTGVMVPQNSGVALVIVPDTTGDFISALAGTVAVSSSAKTYLYASVGSAAWTTTETNVLTLGQGGGITKDADVLAMYVQSDSIPSSGSYTIILMQNQVSTVFSCTISSAGASPDCSAFGKVTLIDGNEYDVQVAPSGGVIEGPPSEFSNGGSGSFFLDGGDEIILAPSPPFINVGFEISMKQRRVSIAN